MIITPSCVNATHITIGDLAGSDPAWSRDQRLAAAVALRHLPQPTPRDEAWRYTHLSRLAPPAAYLSPAGDFRGCPATPVMVRTLGEESLPPADAEQGKAGVTVQDTTEALNAKIGSQGFFFVNNAHQRDYFSALNCAWRNGGAWFEASANTGTEATSLAEHQPQVSAYFPHSVALWNAGSRAAHIEHFRGDSQERQVWGNIELHIAPNATGSYALLLDWGERTDALMQLHLNLHEGSQAEIFIVTLGGRTNKVMFTSDIVGSNASCRVYGLTYADGKQVFEVNLLQKHHVDHSQSDVLYHCALDGQARTVFAGNIDVCQAAQKSDAYQKNRNLLLSPLAHAYSQPQLEIVADDVRCTHGANFTSYDPEQQFYLQSRGIAPAEAQRLIVSGFLQEIVGHFRPQAGREYLATQVQRRLGQEEAYDF